MPVKDAVAVCMLGRLAMLAFVTVPFTSQKTVRLLIAAKPKFSTSAVMVTDAFD